MQAPLLNRGSHKKTAKKEKIGFEKELRAHFLRWKNSHCRKKADREHPSDRQGEGLCAPKRGHKQHNVKAFSLLQEKQATTLIYQTRTKVTVIIIIISVFYCHLVAYICQINKLAYIFLVISFFIFLLTKNLLLRCRQQQLAHRSTFAHTWVLGSLFWFNFGRHFVHKDKKKCYLCIYLFQKWFLHFFFNFFTIQKCRWGERTKMCNARHKTSSVVTDMTILWWNGNKLATTDHRRGTETEVLIRRHEDCQNANIGIDIGVIWLDSPIRLNKASRIKKWRSPYKLVLWGHFSLVLFVSSINNVICKICFCPQSFICSLKIFKSLEWGTSITPYIPILKWNTMTRDLKSKNGCLQNVTCVADENPVGPHWIHVDSHFYLTDWNHISGMSA